MFVENVYTSKPEQVANMIGKQINGSVDLFIVGCMGRLCLVVEQVEVLFGWLMSWFNRWKVKSVHGEVGERMDGLSLVWFVGGRFVFVLVD